MSIISEGIIFFKRAMQFIHKAAQDVIVRVAKIIRNLWIMFLQLADASVFQAVFYGLLSVLVLLAIMLVISETFKFEGSVFIEPISVPKRLAEMGYTPNVVEQRLIATMYKERARISDPTEGMGEIPIIGIGSSTQQQPMKVHRSSVDFVVPATGLSIKSTAVYLGSFLGLNANVVTGEILYDEPHVSLRLRINDGNTVATVFEEFRDGTIESEEFKENVIDQLFLNGARKVLEEIDLHYLAVRYFEHISTVKANSRAQKEYREKFRKKIKFIFDDEKADTEKKIQAINLQPLLCHDSDLNNMVIDKYKKDDALDEKISHVYLNCGLVFAGKNEYVRAIEKYKKAIELNPDYATAYRTWGRALTAEGKYADAIEKYKKATDLDPTLKPYYVTVYLDWGRALTAEGKYDDAIEKYKKAIELNPDYATAYRNWGRALTAEGKYADAIEKFKKAIELNPDYATAYRNWGLALTAKGDCDSAIEKYTMATGIDGKPRPPYFSYLCPR